MARRILMCILSLVSVVVAQECSVVRDPTTQFQVNQAECYRGGSLYSDDGTEFYRSRSNGGCQPAYSGGYTWPAAYASYIGIIEEENTQYGGLISVTSIAENGYAWLKFNRPINLTMEIRFNIHNSVSLASSTPGAGNVYTTFQIVPTTQLPVSNNAQQFQFYFDNEGFFYYFVQVQGTSLEFYIQDGTLMNIVYPTQEPVSFSTFSGRFTSIVSWYEPIRCMVRMQNIILLGSLRICIYFYIKGIVYRACKDDGFYPFRGLFGNAAAGYRMTFLQGNEPNFVEPSDPGFNVSIVSHTLWDIALTDAEVIYRLVNVTTDNLPVGRNATNSLPQGGDDLNLTAYSFDGDSEPVVRWFIDVLPTKGKILVNGTVNLTEPGIVSGNVSYIPDNPYAANLPSNAFPCTTAYDSFTWRPYTALNATEQSPGPYSVIYSLCLYDVLDAAFALNQTVNYRMNTLQAITIEYFDPDTGQNSTDGSYIEAYFPNPQYLVNCSSLEPVQPYQRFPNATGMCIQTTTTSYETFSVEMDVAVSEIPGGFGPNATLTIHVTSPVVAQDLTVQMLENDQQGVVIPWTDTLDLATVNLVITDPWVTKISNTEIVITPALDYFNVWPLGPRPLKYIPYVLMVDVLVVAEAVITLKVNSTRSPIRQQPYMIPSQTLNVFIVCGQLLNVVDPDEDEFLITINGVFTEGTNSKVFFPNFTRALRAQVEVDLCTDWQYTGCSQFRLIANATFINYVMNYVCIEFTTTLTEALLVIEVGKENVVDFSPNATFGLPGTPSTGDSSLAVLVFTALGIAFGALALAVAVFLLVFAIGYYFLRRTFFGFTSCLKTPFRNCCARIRPRFARVSPE